MAKKATKKSTKKKTAAKRTAKKTSTTAPKTVAPQPTVAPRYETKDEHFVLLHLMWILFLFAGGIALVFTVLFLTERAMQPDYYGVAALLFLGWAFMFKIFANMIHAQH